MTMQDASRDADKTLHEDEEEEKFQRLLKKVEEVRQCVYNAFSDTEYPGDEAIAETYNRTGRGLFFFGEKWQDMPPGVIMGNDDTLLYFRPDAFRYYLPAFMIVSLAHPTMEFVAPIFVPPFASQSCWTWPEFADRFAYMTVDQDRCISLYIDLVDATGSDFFDPSIAESVVKFWKKPYFLTE